MTTSTDIEEKSDCYACSGLGYQDDGIRVQSCCKCEGSGKIAMIKQAQSENEGDSPGEFNLGEFLSDPDLQAEEAKQNAIDAQHDTMSVSQKKIRLSTILMQDYGPATDAAYNYFISTLPDDKKQQMVGEEDIGKKRRAILEALPSIDITVINELYRIARENA